MFLEGLGILVVRAAKISLNAFDVPVWSAPVSYALSTILPASTALVSVFAA